MHLWRRDERRQGERSTPPVGRNLNAWVWIGGAEQRWVKWTEIYRQVAKAYDDWRANRAQRGTKIYDAAEMRHHDMTQALARRAKK